MELHLFLLTLIFILVTFCVYKYTPNKDRITSVGRKLPQKTSREASSNKSNGLPKLVFDASADMPVGFGYKTQWFVINTEIANWSTGIVGAYEGYYFVTPPVKGWTVVVNTLMPDLSVHTNDNPLKVIQKFSKKYREAYYFGTHRIVDYHAWAKAIDGEVVRAYGYLGESDEILIDQGELTPEEIENNLVYTGLEVEEPILPNEEHVILLSKEWTIDPLMDYIDLDEGVGLAGMKGTLN